MKLEILDDTGSVIFTLAGGALESPEDLELSGEDQVQTVGGLRAMFSTILNRGNRTHRLTFQRTIGYEDLKAAEAALLDFPATVPGSGTIKITTEGSSPNVRWLLGGAVHAFAAKQTGVSLFWRFTITGGELTDTDPFGA